ncbi:MAG: AMP-binding protein [Candidatus Omnitrophota bacterium]
MPKDALTHSNIFREFERVSGKSPSAKAINYKDEQEYSSLSYSELKERALRLGSALYARGIRRLDTVALVCEPGPNWPVSFLALQYIGAICVPLDMNLPVQEMRELYLHSRSKMLLTTEKTYAQRRERIDGVGPENVLRVNSEDAAKEITSLPEAAINDLGKISPEEIAVIFYTSGTTKTPKGVMLTHGNLLSNVWAIKELGVASSEDVFISLLPLHHTYAFTATCLFPLLLGATIVYPGSLVAADLPDCMKRTGVTFFVGVPQLYLLFHARIKEKFKEKVFPVRFLLNCALELFWLMRRTFKINPAKTLLSEMHSNFGPAFKWFVTGGARLDPAIEGDFFKWGFTLLEGYGLTETSPIVAINTPDRQKIGSVGKPIPGVLVEIDKPGTDGSGEIKVKGPSVMKGYFNLVRETDRVIRDDWFYTGDLGRLDKDGYLYIRGRKDEMIVLSSGENINPEEMENHYCRSPYIKEVCVFASKGGGYFKQADQLVAIVVPDEEYFRARKEVNIDEKIKWQLDQLSHDLENHKRVKGFAISTDKLPRTALGKIQRHKVQIEYSNKSGPQTRADSDEVNEEDRALLESEICRDVLNYLSKRLKRQVKLSDHLELDLGVDSLGRIELLLDLSDALKMNVPESAVEDFFYSNTVKELFLKAKPYLPKGLSRIEEPSFVWSDALKKEPRQEVLGKMRIDPSFTDKLITLLLFLSFGTFFRLFFRFEVKNKEKIPSSGPFIVFANHASYLDGLFIAAALPFKLLLSSFFLGLREIFMMPVIKNITKPGRVIPIDIALNAVDAFQVCVYLLKRNKSICYFPEGQRSPDGKMVEFKKGIGILAKETNAPLVPMYIKGSFDAWSRYGKLPRPTKVEIIVGDKFSYSDLKPALKASDSGYENIAASLRAVLLKMEGSE